MICAALSKGYLEKYQNCAFLKGCTREKTAHGRPVKDIQDFLNPASTFTAAPLYHVMKRQQKTPQVLFIVIANRRYNLHLPQPNP